jgi:hypothetical protein
MIETIQLKKQLLTEMLGRYQPVKFAHSLSAVDALYTIYKQKPEALIYTDYTPYKAAMRLFDKALSAPNMKQVIELARKNKGEFYIFLIPEADLEKTVVIGYLLELLNNPVNNFGLVVIGVSGKDSGNYYPVFKHKTLADIARPYQVYFTTPGEGFGGLENTKEILDMAITRELYDLWLSNIDRIESEKAKLLEESNGDKESTATE